MKYKRLLAGVTILFFVVIAVFSFNFLFKISDVKLSVTHIENSPENIKDKLSDYSKTLEGQNLLFISENDIKNDVLEFSPYIDVISIEKIFPCSIKITVTELEEIFSLKSGDKFYMLDSTLRVLSKKDSNVNNVTSSPNLTITADESDYQTLKVGSKVNFLDSVTNDYLSKIIPLIDDFKENIINVDINVLTQGVINRTLTLTTIEGMTVQFDNINVKTVEKFEFFKNWYNLDQTIKEGNYFITVDKNSNQIVVRT